MAKTFGQIGEGDVVRCIVEHVAQYKRGGNMRGKLFRVTRAAGRTVTVDHMAPRDADGKMVKLSFWEGECEHIGDLAQLAYYAENPQPE